MLTRGVTWGAIGDGEGGEAGEGAVEGGEEVVDGKGGGGRKRMR